MANTKVFTPIAASNHSSGTRAALDYYATDAKAIDSLIRAYPLPPRVLEPCCGCGSLSERLKSFGIEVISEDLYDHGYGTVGKDFFLRTEMPEGCTCIVTNLPYKEILRGTLHALSILPAGGVLCSFCKTTFLESKARYQQLFSKQPPKYVLQFVNRIRCYNNGIINNDSSAVAYAWFVWEKGWTGDTVIKWLS